MDTFVRSMKGAQAKAAGEAFERMVMDAAAYYEELGVSVIDKTPEAFKILRPADRNKGQFVCCFTKQAQPDFKGILVDSTMVLFDAKHTDKNQIAGKWLQQSRKNVLNGT